MKPKKKNEIAHNLIDFLDKETPIKRETVDFVGDWILTTSDQKRKAFYDVWDIVLKNYLPSARPVLFRSCNRISKKEKIASFTSRLVCAKRFSQGKGYLIICDTKEQLEIEGELYKPGQYENTFYPLAEALVKARELGGCGFSEFILDHYIGEDEYIMKTNPGNTQYLKWTKNGS